MAKRYSRRRWLKTVAATAGAASTSRLFEAPSILAEPSPISKLAVAVIGCGGRGEASLAAASGEKLVALVDVEDGRLAAAARKASEAGATPRTFYDYRRMFDAMHKEIDAVFVATPDHHHAPASMIAIRLGKHVFCEKPLCHDISQARALAEAAKAHKVTTMMGNQGHCEAGYRRLCEYIWAGAIGDVVETHSWSGFVNGDAGGRPPSKPVPAGLHWDEWLGPAPYRGYHDGLHPLYWRYYWDFGTGGLGDWGCHNLDGVFWALKLGAPASIECLGTIGGSDEKYPQSSIIRWNIPARGQPARPEGLLVRWGQASRRRGCQGHGKDTSSCPIIRRCWRSSRRNTIRISGRDGTAVRFISGARESCTPGVMAKTRACCRTRRNGRFQSLKPESQGSKAPTLPISSRVARKGSPRAPTSNTLRQSPSSSCLGHLAIKAGVGATVEWDSTNLRCTNLPEINRWVQRECRKGWELQAS